MRLHLNRILSVFLAAGCAVAQLAARHEGTGTVTGHVYCADTNLPARFAAVSLEPVEIGPERPMNGQSTQPTIRVVTTRLDGGFTVTAVKPGTYYVVVRKLGYPSPLLGFSRTELEKPSAALAQQIARAVPTVTVGTGQTAPVEVRVARGGVISGRVLFDDGSPAADVMVTALQQGENGVPNKVQRSGINFGRSLIKTDDQGRFRVIDLAAGEFVLKVEFQLSESLASSMFDQSGSSMNSGDVDRLSVYAGNVFREGQAERIKLGEGEERSGEEIIVPLSKLHTVSGTLVNRTGAVVNGGMVMLSDDREKRPIARASVDGHNGSFHFSFVPEGTYRLEAIGMDVVTTELPENQAAATSPQPEIKVAKMYGWQRQVLVVQNEITGLVVTVPDGAGKTAAAQ